MSVALSDHERRLLDEAAGDLGGALNAILRARALLPRIRGCAEEDRRLREIETALLEVWTSMRGRLS